jgi:hypothetical protein
MRRVLGYWKYREKLRSALKTGRDTGTGHVMIQDKEALGIRGEHFDPRKPLTQHTGD